MTKKIYVNENEWEGNMTSVEGVKNMREITEEKKNYALMILS